MKKSTWGYPNLFKRKNQNRKETIGKLRLQFIFSYDNHALSTSLRDLRKY